MGASGKVKHKDGTYAAGWDQNAFGCLGQTGMDNEMSSSTCCMDMRR